MARTPRFSPGLSQEELARGYKRVGSRSPISKRDVAKALKPYGIKTGGRKSYSDSQLSSLAARAVVKKHKADQAKKKALKK